MASPQVRTYLYASRKEAIKLMKLLDISDIPYATIQRTQELAEAGVFAVDNRGRVVGLCGLNVVSDQTWNAVKLYVPAHPKQVRELMQPYVSDSLSPENRRQLMKFLIETALRFRRSNNFLISFRTDDMFDLYLNGLKMKNVGTGYFPAHAPAPSALYIAVSGR